ncbi:MAG: hypothetical protein RLZZ571_634 [Actinomycetota bacterium]|jgi:multiple antibiotic resistance protein
MDNYANLAPIAFGIQAFITLFVILDPPGVTPIFLAITNGKTSKERMRLAWQGATVSLVLIVSFAVAGQAVLNALHISFNALQGAGGLLMLLIALELLTGKDSGDDGKTSPNIAMVPLGTPLLAGPGAIVATMLFAQSAKNVDQKISLALAIVLVHVVIGLTLMSSTQIVRVIKEAGVTLLARVAGLLTGAIAIEMIVAAVKGFWPS